MKPYLIEVSSLRDTVWVTANDGSCIGRFSKRFGIDVHRTVDDQRAGAGQCLFCTHRPAGEAEWHTFRARIRDHYGIDIPADTIIF
ncbi:hypothetical protein [Cupriavidus malaysiensis]|uniref:Ferredoxin n=1 Tax=Cupriavidus malaysiensis TaxID=367825 RepID=A0ABM6FGS1_9BURK|nr:hypothetical protein [Cupriavidus malaysiensis]AOZ11156.1 hypothetical protein BKK80_34955 [Cupriavidus malaysiensis]